MTEIDDILEHHGIKGQKWGVRRDARALETSARLRRVANGTGSKRDKIDTFLGRDLGGIGGIHGLRPKVAARRADAIEGAVARRETKREVKAVKANTKAVAKADKKFEEDLRGVHGFVKVNNSIAAKVNPRLDVINNKPKYKGVMMLEPQHAALHKSYINEYRKALQTSLDETMSEIGTNASGTKKFTLKVVGEGLDTTWEASLDSVQHEADVLVDGFRIRPYFDKDGFITGQTVEPLSLSQADEAIENVLAHHGIKGQKWGVRRSRNASTGLVARRSSQDQMQVDKIVKKLSSGGTGTLSNKELQDFTRRLQLEGEFSKATALHQAKAQSFVTKFIKKQGARQFNRVADKATDIAVEKALELAGVSLAKKGKGLGTTGKSGVMLSKTNQALGNDLGELSKRLKPKKK